MHATQRFITIAVLTLVLSNEALAKLPITDKVRKICQTSEPCSLHISEKLKPAKITFNSVNRQGIIFVKSIVVRQGDNKQSFTFAEGIEGVHPNEVFPLYYNDVNKDGYQDIMVLATKGAQEWLYHYLIFNKKSKQFIKQTESWPELKKQGSKNLYTSSTEHKFTLNKNLIFVPKK